MQNKQPLSKSLSTSTLQMQKTALMRPKIGSSQVTPNSKTQTQFPKLGNSQRQQKVTIEQSKDLEENYVEKLHSHIQLLNDEIGKLKGKQQDFQGSMMQMMTKDRTEFIDNPIDAQEKFKTMKQRLIRVSHELEGENVTVTSELKALKSKKEYLEKMLQAEEDTHVNYVNESTRDLKEANDRMTGSRQKEVLITNEVLKQEQIRKQTFEQHSKKSKGRKEKAFRDQVDEDNYQQIMEVEQADYDAKVKEFEQLKADIKKQNDQQGEDIRYVELTDRNKELRAQLAALEAERDKINYDLKECELRVKLGDEDKEIEAQERRRMRDELTKYNDIYEDIKIRNQKRIELKVQNSDSQALRKIKSDLNKLEKQAKEQRDEYRSRANEFEKQRLEMMHKDGHLVETLQEIERLEQEYARAFAKKNAIQEDYDVRMGSNADQEEALERMLKEKGYYSEELKKTEEEHAYLKAKAEFLQENVNLEEELRKVKIDDLRNTSNVNLQFNEQINYLQNNWDEMRKFAKYR